MSSAPKTPKGTVTKSWSRQHANDDPDGAPGLVEGPHSPKKKVGQIGKAPVFDDDKDGDFVEVYESGEDDDSGSDDSVEIVEEIVEVTSSEEEEVEEEEEEGSSSNVEDDGDSTEYETDDDAEDESSDFKRVVGPPIKIPEALQMKPQKKEESSSEDSSDEEEEIKDAPAASAGMGSLRPGAVRGMSCESDEGKEEPRRAGKKPGVVESQTPAADDDDDDDVKDPFDKVKEAPRAVVASEAARPHVVRGHTGEGDMFKTADSPRGSKKPAVKSIAPADLHVQGYRSSAEGKQVDVPEKSIVNEETPSMTSPTVNSKRETPTYAKRPDTVRGYSVDDDDDDGEEKRKGKKKERQTKLPLKYKTPPPDDEFEAEMHKKDIEWQKPDWTKKPVLRATSKGEAMKNDGNLAKPITNLPHDTNIKPKTTEWEKPDWTKNVKLRGTKKGEVLKSGSDIARPIGGIKAVDEDQTS